MRFGRRAPHPHALFGAVAILLAAGSATATPTLETLGPVGSRGGFVPIVSDPSPASAYFNPALLGAAKDDFGLAFSVLSEQIALTLDGRRAGGDVPLSVGGRDVIGPGGQPIPNQTVPTQWLDQGCEPGTSVGQCPAPAFTARPRQRAGSGSNTYAYLTLGAVKQLVKDRFSIGLLVTLPLGNLTTARSFYNDEREALFGNSLHPELYGDRLTEISIALAASFTILKGLDFGLGTTIGLSNQASAQTYVRESANYETLLINNDVSVQAALSPIVGVRWAPVERLRIGGVLHAPHSFEIDASIGATLPSGTASSTTRKQVHDWLPWRMGVGAELDFKRTAHYTGTVAAQVEWGAWSGYQDRHGSAPDEYGADLEWKNTLTWSAGVRHRWKGLAGYVDLQYKPSPVPLQIGRSNYVDSDRWGLATGISLDFTLGGVHLRPGIQLVGYRMTYRYQQKDDARLVDELPDGSRFGSTGEGVPGARGLQTNNPGWPGFSSEGWIYGGTLSLDVLL
jgi:hypothetical protein